MRDKKFTINEMRRKKKNGDPITWITAYSYPIAHCAEKSGVDMILVGDSGGMTELGYDNTSPVTMDEMITFCKAVKRGAPNTFIVGDMPQGSYEVSDEDAIKNALRFIKEAGCDAIKLEGGKRILNRIQAIKSAGVLVCGHLGLTPQTTASFGGYSIQGKNITAVKALAEEVSNISECIDFLLIEATPSIAIEFIKKEKKYHISNLPILGIGAGPDTDGQLLIMHDILGFYPNFKPKFAKNYLKEIITNSNSDTMIDLITASITKYVFEVKNKQFPSNQYCYQISEDAQKEIERVIWNNEKNHDIANYR